MRRKKKGDVGGREAKAQQVDKFDNTALHSEKTFNTCECIFLDIGINKKLGYKVWFPNTNHLSFSSSFFFWSFFPLFVFPRVIRSLFHHHHIVDNIRAAIVVYCLRVSSSAIDKESNNSGNENEKEKSTSTNRRIPKREEKKLHFH